MRKLIFCCFTALFFFIVPRNSLPGEPLRIDILYMNHGPVQPTLKNLRDLFPEYGKKIAVFWHDFESDEGNQFKAKMGIREHIPLVIWVDGESTLQVNAQPVTFSGFPTGSGPAFFQGKWTIADLRKVLDRLTSKH
jgi:hypothetical protein